MTLKAGTVANTHGICLCVCLCCFHSLRMKLCVLVTRYTWDSSWKPHIHCQNGTFIPFQMDWCACVLVTENTVVHGWRLSAYFGSNTIESKQTFAWNWHTNSNEMRSKPCLHVPLHLHSRWNARKESRSRTNDTQHSNVFTMSLFPFRLLAAVCCECVKWKRANTTNEPICCLCTRRVVLDEILITYHFHCVLFFPEWNSIRANRNQKSMDY